MRWPRLFDGYVVALSRVALEVFDMVPAECAMGTRIGFELELLATLLSPLVLIAWLCAPSHRDPLSHSPPPIGTFPPRPPSQAASQVPGIYHVLVLA